MADASASAPPVSMPPPEPAAACDYSVHPFLDPDLFQRDRHARLYFTRTFRNHLRNDFHYARLLNRLLHPVGDEHPLEVNERIVASYLQDASTYVRELLVMVPEASRLHFLPDPTVERCNDLRGIAEMVSGPHGESERERALRRFEAQRKMYLAKLLLQVENTRMVQDGPRHRQYLLDLLDQELWSYVKEQREWEARYEPPPEEVREGAPEQSEAWHFRVRRVVRDVPGGSYDLEVYHFDTRFKKEAAGYAYAPGQQDYEVEHSPRYGQMKRSRSASILSKMLRKGINDPLAITDMLGAMFIVQTRQDVHRLAELLHQVLGGPFHFRNQVDLFRRPEDHRQLNPFSSTSFRAFKEDVDILYPGNGNGSARPYFFGVELQILTVEGFLETVHSRAYASHRAYKRRQFLRGVLPYVFPASLYGRPELPGG